MYLRINFIFGWPHLTYFIWICKGFVQILKDYLYVYVYEGMSWFMRVIYVNVRVIYGYIRVWMGIFWYL